jgi:beta-barrel assembly-enhancing protease
MQSPLKISLLGIMLILGGCAKNPVTGKSELHFVNTQKEIQMGEKNYAYGQQMAGGLYTQDPALTAYIQEVGQKLAKASDRPSLPFEFVVLNDSIPNAWAMPGGKLAINRGLLLELENEAELAAVLGHEITHATARHGAKAMERQVLLSAGLLAANVALSSQNSDNTLGNNAILASAAVASQLVNTKYSRNAELEADNYGMEYMVKAGYEPMAAVSLQEKFVKLSEKKSGGWLEGLFASHPPSQHRANANLIHAQKMPGNLTLGEKRYQQKIATLKKQAPAYENYDKGIEALKKKQYVEAQALAELAIKALPTEALFHGLKGDALAKQNQREEALACYDQAIALEKQYFYFYHQRGLLRQKMGQKAQAKEDLKLSQQLLPTEEAQATLASL